MEHEKQTEMRQQIHEDAKDKKKEGARLRQQKHRQDVRNTEIASGERSPGGTKRKRRVCKHLWRPTYILMVT